MLNRGSDTTTTIAARIGGEIGGSVGHHILFDFSVPSYFNEGFPVVKACRETGWRCTVMLEWSGRGLEEASRQCRNIGCTMVELPDQLLYHVDSLAPQVDPRADGTSVETRQPAKSGLRRRLFQWLTKYCPPAGRLIEFIWSFPRLIKLKRMGESIFGKIKPDIAVFGPFNSSGRASNAMFAAAKKFGVPTVCIPFAPLMGEPYQIFQRLEAVRTGVIGPLVRADYDFFNRVCAILLRRWTRSDGKLRLFHRDPVQLIAGRLLRLNLTDGWQVPSPYFDRVFVPSEHSLHCLRLAKYPMERVVLSGMPRMDLIVSSLSDEQVRLEFFRSICLPAGSQFIVLNVEPAAEHNMTSWDDHWRLFHQTIGVVTSFGIPVVLSLHPLCAPENYFFAESEYGAIVRHPRSIYELVAHSAMVVSHVCSTLLTTQMFRKPTVVFDYHAVPNEVGAFFNLNQYIVCKNVTTLSAECRRIVDHLQKDKAPETVFLPAACDIIRAGFAELAAHKSHLRVVA